MAEPRKYVSARAYANERFVRSLRARMRGMILDGHRKRVDLKNEDDLILAAWQLGYQYGKEQARKTSDKTDA